MARARSPEKRDALLQAAVKEIAKSGLSAPTAQIARRAEVATGTLFTYFATKEDLLNELYLALKGEVYGRLNAGFPHQGTLEERARHVWSTVLDWAVEFPEKRKVSMQLNVSDVITAETRRKSALQRSSIDATLSELDSCGATYGMPEGFAAAVMAAMQEATMELVAKRPKQRKQLIQGAFQMFWRAFQ